MTFGADDKDINNQTSRSKSKRKGSKSKSKNSDCIKSPWNSDVQINEEVS